MKKLFLCLLILSLFLCNASAEDVLLPEAEALEKQLPSEAADLMDGLSATQTNDLWAQVKRIVRTALSGGVDPKQGLRLCGILLAIVLLCALAKLFSQEAAPLAVACAGALGLGAAFLFGFQSMMQLATETLNDLTDYTGVLMPVLAGAVSLQGGTGSAAALYGGTMLFSQILMRAVTGILIPATYFYIALSTAEAALGNDTLGELCELLGWCISKALRLMLYAFVGYLSVTGVVSGASDASALKATKAAFSAMVPVVGGILSDASETILAGAASVKATVGVFGMLAVLSVVITPFLRIGVQYLMLKVTSAASATVALRSHTALLKRFSSAMGYLLAMCGVCATAAFFSILCFLKAVTG